MFWSGVKIGMVSIVVLLKPILLVPLVGRTVWTVVAIGAVRPGAVVLRAVTSTLLTTAPTVVGFAWFSPSNDFFYHSLSLSIIKSIGNSWQSRIIIVTSPKIRKFSKGIGYGTKRRY